MNAGKSLGRFGMVLRHVLWVVGSQRRFIMFRCLGQCGPGICAAVVLYYSLEDLPHIEARTSPIPRIVVLGVNTQGRIAGISSLTKNGHSIGPAGLGA